MGGVRNLAFPCSLGKPTDLGRDPERSSGGCHAIPIPIPPLVVLNFQESAPTALQSMHGYPAQHTLPNPSDQHRVNHDTSAKRNSVFHYPVLRCDIHIYTRYMPCVCGRMRVRTKNAKGVLVTKTTRLRIPKRAGEIRWKRGGGRRVASDFPNREK